MVLRPSTFRIVSALIFVASSALADTLAPVTNPFNEELRSSAKIAGGLVAGLQRRGTSNDISISASIPAEWHGQEVCLRVVSYDGLYEAANSYRVSDNWTGGTVNFGFPTEHGTTLAALPEEGLAIRLTRENCNSGRSNDIALSSWSAREDEPFQLLLNSFGADLVYIYVGASAVPVQCEPVVLERRSAFDMRCPIEIDIAPSRISLEILRVVNRKPAPSTILYVVTGG